MKFSDKLIRSKTEKVIILEENKIFRQREISQSNNWELRKNIGTSGYYEIPASETKIGESIFNEDYSFLAYRTE